MNRYEVETNHGTVVIVGTDEQDARVMAEKAGYTTYSAKLIQAPTKENAPDYLAYCKEMGIEPC